MPDREKVINGLECCAVGRDCKLCYLDKWEGNYTCRTRLMEDALALLKEQEPPTVRECKDLDILRRVKSGKVLKSVCKDYVIYNGDWYRKNRWDWPEKAQEPVEPIYDEDNYIRCGKCKHHIVGIITQDTGGNIMPIQKYCAECGRKVKWE